MAHERLSGMLGKQLSCPFCSVISTTEKSLLDHVELEHPNWIDSFNNKLSLIRHVQMQSSNSQDIKDPTESKQATLEKSENFLKMEVKNQDYTDRKSFKTKRGLTVITLSLEEKVKLIADSKKPGFCRKEVVAKYGININTITNILKKQDKILKIVESGQRQVIPRVRLSLQEKAKLIEESKQPGFNKKEMAARYGINLLTVSNILSNQDKILKMIESGIGHKTNANFGKEKHASNSDKMSYQYKSSLHHATINKPSL
jgi:transposase-like protein